MSFHSHADEDGGSGRQGTTLAGSFDRSKGEGKGCGGYLRSSPVLGA